MFPDQRVLSRAEHEAIVATDAGTAARRDALTQAVGETRTAFLVALPE